MCTAEIPIRNSNNHFTYNYKNMKILVMPFKKTRALSTAYAVTHTTPQGTISSLLMVAIKRTLQNNYMP